MKSIISSLIRILPMIHIIAFELQTRCQAEMAGVYGKLIEVFAR